MTDRPDAVKHGRDETTVPVIYSFHVALQVGLGFVGKRRISVAEIFKIPGQ